MNAPASILLVRLGSLGDIVHALPVAAFLRESFPDARLDWLVDARQRDLLDLVPVIDRRVVVNPSARGFVATIRALRRDRCDVALDLQGLWKSALLARGSGARRVIGFPRAHLREPAAALFYSDTSDVVSGPHIIQKNLSLVRPLGLDPERVTPVFPLTIPDSGVVAEVSRRLQLRPAERFALINPGAAWPNKRWPPERFGQISAGIARRHGLRSAVLWGPGEESLADQVAAASEGAAAATPRTSIADLLALAREARLMVSGDTGPLHLAAAVGTPTVALFGPTDPERNGSWCARDLSLSQYTACTCHYQRRCQRPAPCLFDIGTDDVLGAIERRLAVTPADV